jgi:hypothetical protein
MITLNNSLSLLTDGSNFPFYVLLLLPIFFISTALLLILFLIVETENENLVFSRLPASLGHNGKT